MSLKIDFFSTSHRPMYQAMVAFGLMLIFIVPSIFIELLGISEISAQFPWQMVGTFLLVYVIFNCLYSLGAKNKMTYWRDSIFSYAALFFMGILLATFASASSIFEQESYHSIFMAISIVYLIFLSITNLLTKFMDFAEKEEWNQPKNNK